jgi:hypothetical protein
MCRYFFILILLSFIFSCTDNKNNQQPISDEDNSPYLVFTYDSLNKNWGNCTNEEGQCITIQIKYPKITEANEELKYYLEAKIKLFFGEFLVMNEEVNYSELTIEQMADSAIQNYRNIIAVTNQTLHTEPPWDYQLSVQIDTVAQAYVTLTLTAYTFTGGAHGNHILKHFSFHHNTLAELTIYDVFTHSDSLLIIAEEEFRNMHDMKAGVAYADAGFDFPEDKFILTDNFALYKEGVSFYYNSYEIAPYSVGPIELFIPYSKVYNLLINDLKTNIIINTDKLK